MISVIVPLYNKGPYIKRALASIFAQTIQDFEIIVVGGKSSDGGEIEVINYPDSRIRFIQETGDTVGAARNQGVSVAKAEIIAFLDADDEWLPEFLETILRLREKYPQAGMYSTEVTVIKNDAPYKDKVKFLSEVSPIKKQNDLLITNMFKYLTNHALFFQSAICIPKMIFLKIGGYRTDCNRGEDTDLFGRIGLYGYSIGYCNNKLVLYHSETPGSLMKNSHFAQLYEHPFQNRVKLLQSSSENNPELIPLQDYDLMLFLDSLNFTLANNNLRAHFPQNARKCLSRIYHKELQRRKYKKYILSYVPRWIFNYFSKFRK